MANTSVFGIYSSQTQLENAVDMMRKEGFRNADISVLYPENQGNKTLGVEKSTKAPEGTATGVASGAVVGGALGWLAGIGMRAIPGVGPFISPAPIMGMLRGMGVGGAVGGLSWAVGGNGDPR